MALKVSSPKERTPRQSLMLFGLAVVLGILGVAGLILHSFAYPLALLLAALFGISGLASLMTRGSRQRGLLLWIAIAVAVTTTYVFLVSGGGGPPAPTPSR